MTDHDTIATIRNIWYQIDQDATVTESTDPAAARLMRDCANHLRRTLPDLTGQDIVDGLRNTVAGLRKNQNLTPEHILRLARGIEIAAEEVARHTRETDHLAATVNRQAQELAELTDRLDKVAARRDKARDQRDQARAERDAARTEVESLTTERDRLAKTGLQWKEAGQAAAKACDTYANERDQARRERDRYRDELDLLKNPPAPTSERPSPEHNPIYLVDGTLLGWWRECKHEFDSETHSPGELAPNVVTGEMHKMTLSGWVPGPGKVLTTVEELDELEDCSVVKPLADGGIRWQKATDDQWMAFYMPARRSSEIALPVTVLWEPADE